MKMRFVACMLVLALLLCGVAAYGVYCEAYATLSPAKSDWYVRAALVGPLGNTVSESGRVYVSGVSGSNYAISPTINKHYSDVHARGNWGGIY